MVSLFDTYEQQYSTLTADITSEIGQLTALGAKDRRQLISNIEKHVEEAQELLEQMDLEIREIESTKRQRCRTKLDCYRMELKRLTSEYIRARSIKQEVLYDSQEDNDIRISNDQKQSLLDNSETLDRAGRKLNDSYKVVIETEEIGNQVLKNLAEHRETIQRSRNRLKETDEELGKSSRILSSMLMRSIQHRIILFVVAISLLVVICFGIYIGLRK